MSLNRSLSPLLVILTLLLLATVLRIPAALRPGLWSDEIFSLAMATGHSLEHPAAQADSSLGDFVEPREAQPPAVFRRYAEHEENPAGMGRVLRAVLRSDTSPPLYYLLLNRWTRGFGTGDAALRLFSVGWAVLSLPLLWLVGRKLEGDRVGWTACLLFSFSPVAVYYSVEGRMYSLLWFLALVFGWLTLQLLPTIRRPWLVGLWVLTGVAGLLTHYFFIFVWLACLTWLWVRGEPSSRGRLAMLAATTLLALLPWYLEVPASLARWRVSGSWLSGELIWPQALGRPLYLAGSLLSGSSPLPGWRWADPLLVGLFLLLAIGIAQQGRVRRMLSSRPILLWGWLAAACLGPLLFDLVRHSTTSGTSRYALPGLPAAILLTALAMSQLTAKIHLALLSAVVLVWLTGTWTIISSSTPRPWEPYREVDARLESWARPDDLVLVRSIPSGIIGVARYLKRDLPVAAWVAQLGNRDVPADLEALLRGREGIAVVKIHDLGAPGAPEAWLEAHTRLLRREVFRMSRAELWYFESPGGDTLFRAESPLVSRPALGSRSE